MVNVNLFEYCTMIPMVESVANTSLVPGAAFWEDWMLVGDEMPNNTAPQHCSAYSNAQFCLQSSMRTIRQCIQHCAQQGEGGTARRALYSAVQSSGQETVHRCSLVCPAVHGAVRTAVYGATRWCSELSLLLSPQASAAGAFSVCSEMSPVSLPCQHRLEWSHTTDTSRLGLSYCQLLCYKLGSISAPSCSS